MKKPYNKPFCVDALSRAHGIVPLVAAAPLAIVSAQSAAAFAAGIVAGAVGVAKLVGNTPEYSRPHNSLEVIF